jgi:predicted nuclease of predicted toxin-antitoxin system
VKLLLDEMFPSGAARQLQESFGHDAVHVDDLGLRGADDQQVVEVVRLEGRTVVTENVADHAAERDLVLVCLLKRGPIRVALGAS